MCCKFGIMPEAVSPESNNWELFAIEPLRTPPPPAAPAAEVPWQQGWSALTDGVKALQYDTDRSSRLVVYGPRSFPIAMSKSGETTVGIGCVAVPPPNGGPGCALVLGHENQLKSELSHSSAEEYGHGWAPRDRDSERGDVGTLLLNAFKWLSRKQEPQVGYSTHLRDLGSFLMTNGVKRTAVEVDADFEAQLRRVDVYVAEASGVMAHVQVAAVQRFVADGGGLVVAGHGWSWAYTKDMQDLLGNKLLDGLGIFISGKHIDESSFDVPSEAPGWSNNVKYAFDTLLSGHRNGGALDATARVAVRNAASDLPLDLEEFNTQLDEFRDDLGDAILPTLSTKVEKGSIGWLVVEVELQRMKKLPPSALFAHPAAKDFPGETPDGAILTEAQVVRIDATYEGRDRLYMYSGASKSVMRSTGLYAAAGVRFTVTLEEGAVGAGLELLIGCHTDNLLANRDTLSRFPTITRTYSLSTAITEAGNTFGGLIYITVPGGSSLGEIEISFSGVSRALTYWHGVDDASSWQAKLKLPTAPWAEFVTDKIIFSVPESAARKVADPVSLMTLWDELMDSAADLEGTPHTRSRPERFVLDQQISFGLMHAGYPLMGHLDGVGPDSADVLLDVIVYNPADGKQGDQWGPFHELGHNFQYDPWMLPGTQETTCNLWSVYMFEQIGFTTATHSAITAPQRAARLQEYLDTGPDFWNEWKVWTALETYLQLKEAFGWNLFTELFTQYRSIPTDQMPSTTQQKIDEWVLRSSRVANVDLGPFYQAWGFPVSRHVLQEVGKLATWAEDPMRDRRRLATNTNATPLVMMSSGSASEAAAGVHEIGGELIAYDNHFAAPAE